jgi:hypothetical protein
MAHKGYRNHPDGSTRMAKYDEDFRFPRLAGGGDEVEA